jgi:hypothetical protein
LCDGSAAAVKALRSGRMSTQDSASDFRNIEKALRLLRAYEANPAAKVQDNPAYQAVLREVVSFDDPEESVVQGLTVLSSLFLGELATLTAKTRADVLAAYERQTESSIKELEGE